MHSPQNNFTLVIPYMKMVCFYHSNVPYLRISDLFTDKYTYLQVSVKSLSFIIHEIFDTNLYCINIIEFFGHFSSTYLKISQLS